MTCKRIGVLIAIAMLLLVSRALPANAFSLDSAWGALQDTGLTGVSANVAPEGPPWSMYYNDGPMAMAVSVDGKSWRTEAGFAPPQPAEALFTSNPWVFRLYDGRWRMIFEGQDEGSNRRLYSAVSADGLSFAYEGLVMAGDVRDLVFDDETGASHVFLSVPDGLRLADGSLRMYFVSQGDLIASAVSTDEGLTWTRDPGVRAEQKVDPSVIALPEGGLCLFYSDWEKGARAKRVGYARSDDGLDFTHREWLLEVTGESPAETGDPYMPGGYLLADPDIVRVGTGDYYLYVSGGEGLVEADIFRLDAPDGWGLPFR